MKGKKKFIDPIKKHHLKIESHNSKTRIILDGVHLEDSCDSFTIEQKAGGEVTMVLSHFISADLEIDADETIVNVQRQ